MVGPASQQGSDFLGVGSMFCPCLGVVRVHGIHTHAMGSLLSSMPRGKVLRAGASFVLLTLLVRR